MRLPTIGAAAFLVAVSPVIRSAQAGVLDLSAAPVVGSSVENGTTPASSAFDNNNGTRWSSQFSDPQFIYVDLGQSYSLNSATIDWETASGQNYGLYVYNGATAPDPTTSLASWTQIATVTGRNGVDGSASGPDDTYNFAAGTFTANAGTDTAASVVANPSDARYVMMYGTTRATGFGYSIHEMKIDATAVPEPTSLGIMGLAASAILARRGRRTVG